MALTITWSDNGVNTVYTVPDTAYASLDSYRQTVLKQGVDANNLPAMVVQYASVLEMIVATFINQLITPAFSLYPPPTLATAAATAAAAAVALATAKATAIAGSVVAS